MSSMEDADFALALRLQEEENRLAGLAAGCSGRPMGGGAVPDSRGGAAGSGPTPGGLQRLSRRHSPARPLPPPGTSLVDESFELIDPTPDIYQLFRDFDKHFFWSKLGGVELKWSPRMTRCAGVCSYQPASGLCSVRLSRPLLTLRPRSDLVETLLHEMIHALLFVTRNIDNHEEHGPEFHRHMHRINKIAGTNISVYHTFHDEVRHMLTHWWRCTGACRRRPPHFGFVKRSMNRAPGKNDFWWRDHQASCGGTFEKIREPEGYGKKKGRMETATGVGNKLQDIRNFVVNGKAPPLAKKPAGRPAVATGPGGGRGRPRTHSGRQGGSSGVAADSRRTPTAGPPVRPAGGGPTRRPAPQSGGHSSPKRPLGGAAGVRPVIATVGSGGGLPVSSLSNNAHGFQKRGGTGRDSTAMAGGSRTVTVPPRRGGGGREVMAGAEVPPRSFGGGGRVLGGSRSLPWYKRDPPPAAPSPAPPTSGAAPAASAPRPATGIFSSSETSEPAQAAGDGSELHDSVNPVLDDVSCPVCWRKVGLQNINDHVDLCLVAKSERGKERGKNGHQPYLGPDSIWEDTDELMMSQAADLLETSLEAAGWTDGTEDDRMLADAAVELEASAQHRTAVENESAGDRTDTWNSKIGDDTVALRSQATNDIATYELLIGKPGGVATLSPVSEVSTVYDELLDGKSEAALAARSPGCASTAYDDILDGPIVINSSDDEEDYAGQRANLSDVIKEFIKVDESDDELFNE